MPPSGRRQQSSRPSRPAPRREPAARAEWLWSRDDSRAARACGLRRRGLDRAGDDRAPSAAPAQGRVGARALGFRCGLGRRRRAAQRRQRDRGARRWWRGAPAHGRGDRGRALARPHRRLVRHAGLRADGGRAAGDPARPPRGRRSPRARARAAVGRSAVADVSGVAARRAQRCAMRFARTAPSCARSTRTSGRCTATTRSS